MNSSIKHYITLMVLVATFVGCNQGPSLQRYYVDNELKPGFTSVDIPTSLLNIDQGTLSKEQKEAYKSVDKLNMLAFIISDDNKEQFEVEHNKITEILQNPKYEELMRGGNPDEGKFIIKFLGEEDDIDELILFGSANDRGFAVIRILGDNMSAKKLMTLSGVMQTADFNDSQLSKISDIFK